MLSENKSPDTGGVLEAELTLDLIFIVNRYNNRISIRQVYSSSSINGKPKSISTLSTKLSALLHILAVSGCSLSGCCCISFARKVKKLSKIGSSSVDVREINTLTFPLIVVKPRNTRYLHQLQCNKVMSKGKRYTEAFKIQVVKPFADLLTTFPSYKKIG